MTRIVDVDATYMTRNVYKNLARFAKRYPEAAEFCEFDEGHTNEEIAKSLPLTDKYNADGTINEEWTYYFDIDFYQDGMYIWFIERA